MWTTLWNTNMPLLQWGVVIIACIAAAVWDASQRRIPNKLTGGLFVSGLVWAVCVGGFAGIGDGLVGCAILSFPYVLLFLLAGGGAGDAKMMGAIGMWFGIINSLAALLGVSIAGIIIGIIYMARKRGLSSVGPVLTIGLFEIIGRVFFGYRWQLPKNSPQKDELKTKMPYGAAILTGVCLAAVGMVVWRQI